LGSAPTIVLQTVTPNRNRKIIFSDSIRIPERQKRRSFADEFIEHARRNARRKPSPNGLLSHVTDKGHYQPLTSAGAHHG
jgi:hypothetical protein